MPSIRSAMPLISLAAAAVSVFSGADGRLRSCCRASPASDNSSAITSAASSNRRSSPAWPSPFANSVILLSTYCASRRVRVSCPSAQESGKSRPFTLTTTSAISARLLFQEPVELGDCRLDPAGNRGGGRRDLFVAAVRGLPGRRGGFEPRHGAFEPRQRLGELAQRLPQSPGLNPWASMHLLVFLQGADVGRARRVEELRPLRPRHLADIEVAARVDGEAVRPEKRGRGGAGMRVAKARQQLALGVDDADARPEIGAAAVDPHP